VIGEEEEETDLQAINGNITRIGYKKGKKLQVEFLVSYG
jgi:hypothetical protein